MIRKKDAKTNKVTSELYDLERDSTEKTNLYGSESKVAQKLDRWLDEFVVSLNKSIDGKDYREGRVLPGEPKPTRWHLMPKYEPYFDEWRKRPEYKSLLKPRIQDK